MRGALAFSHVEPAGHILFNDNALIPLNSIIRVGKGASAAEVGGWDLRHIYISIFSDFISFRGRGYPGQRGGMSFSSGALWGRPGAPFLSGPLSAFVPSSRLSGGETRRCTRETDVRVIGGGFECARGFDAAAGIAGQKDTLVVSVRA